MGKGKGKGSDDCDDQYHAIMGKSFSSFTVPFVPKRANPKKSFLQLCSKVLTSFTFSVVFLYIPFLLFSFASSCSSCCSYCCSSCSSCSYCSSSCSSCCLLLLLLLLRAPPLFSFFFFLFSFVSRLSLFDQSNYLSYQFGNW